MLWFGFSPKRLVVGLELAMMHVVLPAAVEAEQTKHERNHGDVMEARAPAEWDAVVEGVPDEGSQHGGQREGQAGPGAVHVAVLGRLQKEEAQHNVREKDGTPLVVVDKIESAAHMPDDDAIEVGLAAVDQDTSVRGARDNLADRQGTVFSGNRHRDRRVEVVRTFPRSLDDGGQ